MKRLALVLASALFGTGCFVHDDHDCDRLMTLEWEFQDFDGAIRGCTAPAGRDIVQTVDVWVDGVYVTSFFCEDLAGTIAISSRAQLVTVEGISGGRIAFRHEFAPSPSCADQFVAVTPAQGTVAVDYAFSPDNACAAPATFIALSVRDDIAAQNAVFEDAATGPSCSVVDAAPEWLLPVGAFTLEWIEEVTGSGAVLAADCADRPFTVEPGLATVVQPTLLDTNVACP
jgi:hypothetical protein